MTSYIRLYRILIITTFCLATVSCFGGRSKRQTDDNNPAITQSGVNTIKITHADLAGIPFTNLETKPLFKFPSDWSEEAEMDWEVAVYPLARTGEWQLMLVRRQRTEARRYYIAVMKDGEFRDAIVFDRAGESYPYPRDKRTGVFFEVSPSRNKEDYDVWLCTDNWHTGTEDGSGYGKFERRLTRYAFNDKHESLPHSPDMKFRNPWRTSEQETYAYHHFMHNGAPDVILTTDQLLAGNIGFITLDSLFNTFPIRTYENDVEVSDFYILPKHFHSHDLILERSHVPEGYRYRLLQMKHDQLWFQEQKIELTPEYKDNSATNIKTWFRTYEGNVIIICREQKDAAGMESKEIFTYTYDDSEHPDDGYYRRSLDALWFGSHRPEFGFNSEAEGTVVKFLKWYRDNAELLNTRKFVLRDEEYEVIRPLKLNENATTSYMETLRESGLVSDEFLEAEAVYVETMTAYIKDDPENEEITELLSPDRFILEYDSGQILYAIGNGHIIPVLSQQLTDGRRAVAVNFGPQTILYFLSETDGAWLIDSYEPFNLDEPND